MVLGSIPWCWDRSLGSELNMICPKDLGPSNGFGWTNQYFTGVFFSPQNDARTLRVQWSLGCNHKSGWVLACLYINSKKNTPGRSQCEWRHYDSGCCLGTGDKKYIDSSTTSCWEGQCLTIANGEENSTPPRANGTNGTLGLGWEEFHGFCTREQAQGRFANVFADCSDTPPEV